VSVWRLIRSFPVAVQVLLVNQLGVNTGFYLLIPFLTAHLGGGLGMSTTLVGVVLGVRTLSQQGLFLLGGSAADRLGARGVIIAGCALRTVGFGLFALGDSFPVVLAAAFLTGLAGALFSPAVRTYIAVEAAGRRAEAFALFTLFANVGTLAGPLLGSVLLLAGFRVSAILAAAIFAVLTVWQVVVLPVRRVPPASTSVLADWREVFADRRFLAFTAAASGLFALESQLYLVLPWEAQRQTGSPWSIAVVFLVSTVLTLAFQMRVTTALQHRWTRGRSIAVGIALLGGAFGVMALGAALSPSADPPASVWDAAWRLMPVLITTTLLAGGLMIAKPFVYELIPGFGRIGLEGTYFGVFYLASGLAAAVANAVLGWAAEAADGQLPWLPAALCVLIGAVGATATLVLHRRGTLRGES
jgi:MFS family permease